MKVLHVLANENSGGASKACFRLHQALLANGIDSSILMLNKPPIGLKNAYHYYPYFETKSQKFFSRVKYKFEKLLKTGHSYFVQKHRSIQARILKQKEKGLEVFTFPISNWDITTHPIYNEANIIHLHWVSSGFIDYKTYFRNNKKPILWTLHDMNPFTGGCHFSGTCDRYLIDCEQCPELTNTQYPNYSNFIFGYKEDALRNLNNLTIICPSQWLKNCSEKSSLFKKFKHSVIPYPVDEKVFNIHNSESLSVELEPSVKKRLLFSAYNLSNRRKGLNLLIDALKKYESLSDQIELVIVGKSNPELNLEGYTVHNLGFIENDKKLSGIYRMCDVYIMPTIADNLPNTVIESLMCGTPVIGFNVGGMCDMVKNNKNGFLIDDFSSLSLYNTIKHFLNQSELASRDEISKNMTSRYSYDEIVKQHSKIYNQVINGYSIHN